MKINCSICKGKGYIYDSNTAIPCKCQKQRRMIAVAEESGLGKLLENALSNFKTDTKHTKRLKQSALDFLKGGDWYAILGQSGAGKTTICSCICNELIKQGKVVYYLKWNHYTRRMKNYDSSTAIEREQVFEKYAQVEVLCIDDLLKGSKTDADKMNMYDLLDYRYSNDLKTIISSEYLIDDLWSIDEATGSRMSEKCGEHLINIPKERKWNLRLRSKNE